MAKNIISIGRPEGGSVSSGLLPDHPHQMGETGERRRMHADELLRPFGDACSICNGLQHWLPANGEEGGGDEQWQMAIGWEGPQVV